MFPSATAARIEAARKNVREVLEEDLDRTTDPWTDKATGERLELVRSYFNIIDPAESGAVAFTISDGNILGLRPAGYEHRSQSTFVGNLGGGRAHDRRGDQAATAGDRTSEDRVLAADSSLARLDVWRRRRRERAARERAAWAVKHHLDPARIYQPQPQLIDVCGFGGLRPTPSAYELDRRSRRVDAILREHRR